MQTLAALAFLYTPGANDNQAFTAPPFHIFGALILLGIFGRVRTGFPHGPQKRRAGSIVSGLAEGLASRRAGIEAECQATTRPRCQAEYRGVVRASPAPGGAPCVSAGRGACPMAPMPAAAPRIAGAGLGLLGAPPGGAWGFMGPVPRHSVQKVSSATPLACPIAVPVFFEFAGAAGRKILGRVNFWKLIKNSNRNVALH